MIDCSHANSNKEYLKQPRIFLDVVKQIHDGNTKIFGIMLESYLEEGNQPYGNANLKRGVSITDACISFPETERIIMEAYQMLKSR